MCDPVTIAGAALTALSTGANAIANQQARSAQKDAMAAERIRQTTLDREAEALNLAQQGKVDKFGGDQEARAASLADMYAEQVAAPPTAADALPESASNITVKEEKKQRGLASADTARAAAALGQLRAFGDVFGDFSRSQARNAGQIAQIGGFKEGSSSVLPYELDEASKKGQGLRLLGDLLGGFGGVALNAGLSGGSLAGMFGGGSKNVAPTVRPGNYGATGSVARGRAIDRASVPGYAGYGSSNTRLFDLFG